MHKVAIRIWEEAVRRCDGRYATGNGRCGGGLYVESVKGKGKG